MELSGSEGFGAVSTLYHFGLGVFHVQVVPLIRCESDVEPTRGTKTHGCGAGRIASPSTHATCPLRENVGRASLGPTTVETHDRFKPNHVRESFLCVRFSSSDAPSVQACGGLTRRKCR